MIPFYNQTQEELFSNLSVNQKNGLSETEIKERIKQYGYNSLKTKKKKPFIIMFLEQFKSFMIIILIIAAIISGVVGVSEGEGLKDAYIIFIILLVNAFIGAYQEKKAQSSLEALKNLSAPQTTVLRNGEIAIINAKELVPGDIVIIETGNIIPADLRIIEAYNLKIQESSMTGESLPVEKQSDVITDENVPLGDRFNMAYSSGIVTYGRGKGVVTATGMETEVGKIAKMLDSTESTETPMQKRLEKLGKIIGISILVVCAVIFIIGIIYGNSMLNMFLTAVSLAVAAIPEGLPAVSTIVLAIGVRRLVKKNAIIRTLPSVETLGSATVICSDKTGTLTQNRMTVVEVFTEFATKEEVLSIAVACNDSHVSTDENGKRVVSGDPTETALIDAGEVVSIYKNKMDDLFPRISEIPFDSTRKRMSTINKMDSEKYKVNVKGGLEEVLEICTHIKHNGIITEITSEQKELIRERNLLMASKALRVLAMAYKEIDSTPTSLFGLENGLIFAGMVGMIDPPREEAIVAIKHCLTAGIRPIMITGDHKITALAIATQIGIFREGDLAITGAELANLSDDYFEKNVSKYSVYARVAPEQKVRIVKAWQKLGEVVAMTGDGVNDAPALKQADIGASMGIVGTDVAKEASDMILTDDNFATIVSAVGEGRRIYDNILKVITKLSTNVGEMLLLFITTIFNFGIPLLPIHILWINLVTDSLPALALSMDPAENDIMKRKPRREGSFLSKGVIWRILYQGVIIGGVPLAAYLIGLKAGAEAGMADAGLGLGQTMAFASLVGAQLVHVNNLHSNTKSFFRFNPFKNLYLVATLILSALLGLAVLLIPSLRQIFHFVAMNSEQWIIVVALSFVPLLVVELFKLLKINGK